MLENSSSAPAKIILCGEHAVLHGAKAIVQSIDHHTVAKVCRQENRVVQISSPSHAWYREWALDQAIEEAALIQARLDQCLLLGEPFLLEHPCDWLAVLCAELGLSCGVRVQIQSEAQLGAGMGSSSAAIAATLSALLKLENRIVSFELAWQLARKVEACCHGASSGLDLAASMHGGCLVFQNGSFKQIKDANLECLYWYSSGTPAQTTAECVRWTRQLLSSNPSLVQKAIDISEQFEVALSASSPDSLKDVIAMSSNWLTQIGVVPQRVQEQIYAIRHIGGSAKICGAGALNGEGGGVVLVYAKPNMLGQISLCIGKELTPLKGSSYGSWKNILG